MKAEKVRRTTETYSEPEWAREWEGSRCILWSQFEVKVSSIRTRFVCLSHTCHTRVRLPSQPALHTWL